ncbi:hypothetical protein INT47_003466 [Mucor saturninus]|uniref:Uncharacterized protein n=1 Tax=Mucor saturninus TaxID=64648 RepID=A0A8H7RGN1_9FUNG|nr:hypothetical protein INT47_003466 [Mucor saturninus]
MPIFPSKLVDVSLTDNSTIIACLNLPSDHLRLFVANPNQSALIYSVPDQQEEKWRSHEYFQQPMWTVHRIDYWNGDWVRLSNTLPDINFLIGIELKETDILVNSLMCKIDYLNPDICFSISLTEVPPLTDSHADLLRGSPHWRRPKDQRTEEYYKVKLPQ